MAVSFLKDMLAQQKDLGLEEHSDDVVVVDGDLKGEIAEVKETITEAEVVQNEIDSDVESLVEAQAALEGYLDLLTMAQAEGGVNAQAAGFLRKGLEQYETMFGLEETLTPSIEAFGGTSSARAATEVSIESISETLSKGWEAIKRALASLWNAIKDLAAKITKGVERTAARARKVNQRARATKTTTKKSETITGDFIGRLQVDGQVPRTSVVVQSLTGFQAAALKAYPAAAGQVVKGVTAQLEGARAADVNSLEINVDPAPLAKALGATEKVAEGVARGKIIPGNVAVHFAAGENINSIKVDMRSVQGAKTVAGDKKVLEVLTTNEITNQTNQLFKMLNMVHSDKSIEDGKKLVDDLVKAGDTLNKMISANRELEGMDSAAVANARKALRKATSVKDLMGTSINGFTAYIVRTSNALLNAYEAMLDQYEKAPAAE